ncbi:MAG: Grx4 family monothiol glutaredoxin [Myxococcales bacterium]|nr:Grx4 family monothiol glutaredoxin [Myxococcales bacterium]MCB9750241.1 Grx4 family monothiol glutaredoxin [Myxococcales bacterium]
MDEAQVREFIAQLITDNKVMLFMKGNKLFPQCGFSSAVLELLKKHKVTFGTFNVLRDMDVREGIKAYSDWPTIPQLYIDGEFIGGCDIVREMDETGELAEKLAPYVRAPKPA